MRRSSLLLVLAAAGALTAGCASPGTLGDPAFRVLAAFPGLTYVDGDAEAGTTTVVSLPLLTYHGGVERDGDRDATTCVVPLLASFSWREREVETAPAPAGRPPGGRSSCPPGDGARGWLGGREDETRGTWWDQGSERDARRAPPDDRSAPEGPPDRAPRAGPPSDRAPGPGRPAPDREAPPPPRTAAPGANGETVLEVDGRVLWRRPRTVSDAHLFFPLARVARGRPGVVAVRTGAGEELAYEVGESWDVVRLLPLFSYERRGEASTFMLWPLLGLGHETDASGSSYLRLLYFLRIPL